MTKKTITKKQLIRLIESRVKLKLNESIIHKKAPHRLTKSSKFKHRRILKEYDAYIPDKTPDGIALDFIDGIKKYASVSNRKLLTLINKILKEHKLKTNKTISNQFNMGVIGRPELSDLYRTITSLADKYSITDNDIKNGSSEYAYKILIKLLKKEELLPNSKVNAEWFSENPDAFSTLLYGILKTALEETNYRTDAYKSYFKVDSELQETLNADISNVGIKLAELTKWNPTDVVLSLFKLSNKYKVTSVDPLKMISLLK